MTQTKTATTTSTPATLPAGSDRCPSECRNGQIWNPGTGPYPCPICTTGSAR